VRKYLILLVLVVGLIGIASIVGAEKPLKEKYSVYHCSSSGECNWIEVGSDNALWAHIAHGDCISDSETEVPFVPSGDRPIYCREYTKHKPARY
jgi:CxxC-x17-CxxC domain-containing protein